MRIGKYRVTTRAVIIFLASFIVLFNLYTLAYLPPTAFIFRGTFLSVFIILAALIYLPKSRTGRIFTFIFMAMALVGSIYPMIFEDKLIAQRFRAAEIEVYISIIFFIGLSALLLRTSGGFILFALIATGVLYLVFGHYIPGYFGHKQFGLDYIASILYTDLDLGAFGFYMDVHCRLVSIFMIFASFLITAGLGDVFQAFATWIAGNATGGPAKVSVFSSGLFGMLSGSPVANVAATGAFTIPLMKRVGYKPTTAAAIEAVASTGGNLMPPIMGIGAFLMAEILGIRYLRICLVAIVPALLWFFTVFLTVHFYALKHDIIRWRPPREEFIAVMKAKAHLILAIPFLVGGLIYFAAPEQGAFWAFTALVALTFARKGTRLTWKGIGEFLERYARMFTSLTLFIAAIGILLGAMLGSGIHIKIGVVLLGGIEQWYFFLFITFFLIVLLGMAVPIAAAYLAAVSIVGPMLAQTGVEPLIIHFFVFYIATLAPLTPPVALASFTGARIAETGMMKAALEATVRCLPLWIIPFVLYRHELFFGVGTPWDVLAIRLIILCFGVFIFILGVEGYFHRNLKLLERGIAVIIGIMIVQPISTFYMYVFLGIGAALIVFCLLQRVYKKPVVGDNDTQRS